jgi:hypothetical protein
VERRQASEGDVSTGVTASGAWQLVPRVHCCEPDHNRGGSFSYAGTPLIASTPSCIDGALTTRCAAFTRERGGGASIRTSSAS